MSERCQLSLLLPASVRAAFEARAAADFDFEVVDSGEDQRLRYVLHEKESGLLAAVARLYGLLAELREQEGMVGATELSIQPESASPLAPESRVEIGGRFLVGAPPLSSHAGLIPIPLADRGAFGDGRHPATALALLRMAWLRDTGVAPARLLDARCGAGVLALAAASLWPEAEALACDPSPRARQACARNAAAAGLGGRLRVLEAPPDAAQDLVVAHLGRRPLEALLDGRPALLAPGSRLVSVGHPWGEVDRVEARLLLRGLRAVAREESGGWAEILFVR